MELSSSDFFVNIPGSLAKRAFEKFEGCDAAKAFDHTTAQSWLFDVTVEKVNNSFFKAHFDISIRPTKKISQAIWQELEIAYINATSTSDNIQGLIEKGHYSYRWESLIRDYYNNINDAEVYGELLDVERAILDKHNVVDSYGITSTDVDDARVILKKAKYLAKELDCTVEQALVLMVK